MRTVVMSLWHLICAHITTECSSCKTCECILSKDSARAGRMKVPCVYSSGPIEFHKGCDRPHPQRVLVVRCKPSRESNLLSATTGLHKSLPWNLRRLTGSRIFPGNILFYYQKVCHSTRALTFGFITMGLQHIAIVKRSCPENHIRSGIRRIN
jgi:hypothetical protein